MHHVENWELNQETGGSIERQEGNTIRFSL